MLVTAMNSVSKREVMPEDFLRLDDAAAGLGGGVWMRGGCVCMLGVLRMHGLSSYSQGHCRIYNFWT